MIQIGLFSDKTGNFCENEGIAETIVYYLIIDEESVICVERWY